MKILFLYRKAVLVLEMLSFFIIPFDFHLRYCVGKRNGFDPEEPLAVGQEAEGVGTAGAWIAPGGH